MDARADTAGRPTEGEPLIWDILMTSLVDGLGVDWGLAGVVDFAFHVQSFQKRAINSAV